MIEGKTEVYLNQIEENFQKIDEKRSAIDVTRSEYNFLKEKTR